ncbi:hypothetical protein HPULCUR_007993 [Helicostylum pulchrum]|uniref:Uncharacterized protein n=1 Tax=Helicostylum pulchrum TaxID=562976 RepID=A0ABP9Y6F0_9FUNG
MCRFDNIIELTFTIDYQLRFILKEFVFRSRLSELAVCNIVASIIKIIQHSQIHFSVCLFRSVRDRISPIDYRNVMFRHSTSAEYQKRHTEETQTAPNTRRRVAIDETKEAIKVLKEAALTKFPRYGQCNDREKHFIVCGLNNVIDLTDIKEGSHLNELDEETR